MPQYAMLFNLELDLDNEDQVEILMEELATEIKAHLKENEKIIGKTLAYITKSGTILTTDDMWKLAEEAEQGYDLSNVSSIFKKREQESHGPEDGDGAA